jgi:phosphatidylinositol alpha-mannosyltransferase
VRIGIVSQSYYPRYGGVTEHVHHTALELRRRGHEVTIITSHFRRDNGIPEPGVERIGHNLLIPFNGAFVDLAVGLRLRSQLRGLLRRHDFDLVHTHAPLVPTLPLIAVETAECPQVGTFHTTSGPSRLLQLTRERLEWRMQRLDARIAVSETARDFVAGYFPGKYHIIPNGVDVERFHPDVEPFERWRDPGRVNLLFVGRLDPRKGVQVLLDAMPEVIERTRGRARLLVIGDSYLRSRFEASVTPSARPHVHFQGHVPCDELPRWYATGDIFVSPASGHESFGIVLVEAMATARAVVASDIPGYRSVIQPDVDGAMVPPGDVGALARTLAELVEDPGRRARLAQRGRARALEFAWPRVTDQIEAVYRQVLGHRTACHSAA